MARANILFPHWEQNVPTLGTKHSHLGNKTGLRLAISLILMLLLGVNTAWGQTDYSGTYYIASKGSTYSGDENATNNYYLCPTEDWRYYDATDGITSTPNEKPFMTTYKCRNGSYESSKAIWIIEKAQNSEYYFIKHVDGNKTYYLTHNASMPSSTGIGANRLRLHLDESPSDVENTLFEITYESSVECYDIAVTNAPNNNKYLNINKGNKNSLSGNGNAEGGVNLGGIIGVWQDGSINASSGANSRWYLENAVCAKPQIRYNSSTNELTLSSTTTGAKIYYTLDGTDPTTESSVYDGNNKPTITERTIVKAFATKTQKVNSETTTQTIVVNPVVSTVASVTYNGSAQEPEVTVKDDDTVIPTDEYETEYTDNTDVGIATITITNKDGGSYFVVDCSTTFTILKADISPTVSIDGWTYGEAANTPTVEGNIGGGAVTYEYKASDAETYSTTVPSDAGDYMVRAIIAETSNCNGATTESDVFAISPKSLGDGKTAAEGITIKLTSEGELEYVKDGEIPLTTDEDYTYDIHAESSDHIVAVTGLGNYTGSFRGIYASPQFYDVDGEGAGKAAAVYMASCDINTFEGVNAYTVKSVNTFLGMLIVSRLEYIPKGVPVLLLSESESTGFVASEKDENIDDISEWTANSNLLKMAPSEGVPVKDAQAYMFYLGEFVLTKTGTIKSGRFYVLNPSYTDDPDDPTPAPARNSLMIVEEETTSMDALPHTDNKSADDVWYTLDGCRLSGKPVNKGLYINNGRKTVIK